MTNNINLLNYLVKESRFAPIEKLVAHTLIYHRNNLTGQCNPSVGTLCYETGLSDSSVRRATRDMAQSGFLTKVKRGRSNWYGFQIPVSQTEIPVTQTPKPLINHDREWMPLTDEEMKEIEEIFAQIDEAQNTEGLWRRKEASAYPASQNQ